MTSYNFVGNYVSGGSSTTFEARITLNSGVASLFEITNIGSSAQQTTNVSGINFVSNTVANNTFTDVGNSPVFYFVSTVLDGQGNLFSLQFDSSDREEYSFMVNSAGLSVSGTFTSSAFFTVPGAPTGVSGIPANDSVHLSWFQPNSNGGSAITSYTVTAYDGGSLVSTTTGIQSTTVVIRGLQNGTAYTFKVQAINIVGGSALSDFSAPVIPRHLVCFAEGTRLLTQDGYKAIETLTSEDRLLTTENRSTSLQLSRIHVPCTTKATAPYVVAKGALGENIPSVPLYLSPAHKIAVRDNVWVHASKGATLGLNIKQCPIGKPVTYYHVRCENYARDVILAEGVATESLANLKEDSVTFKKTDKVGVFLRNEYKEPTKSLGK